MVDICTKIVYILANIEPMENSEKYKRNGDNTLWSIQKLGSR